MAAPATFYFDIGSPYGYLASERLSSFFVEPVRWQPVLLGGLFRLAGRSSWAVGDERRREIGMAEIEQRARAYGLPPTRWPDSWPSDYLFLMRVATYAFAAGDGIEFTHQAYRDAFQRGRDMAMPENVLAAARAVGLDPARARATAQAPAVKQELRAATDAAFAIGVIGVPTLAIGAELFWGDDRLEDAAARAIG